MRRGPATIPGRAPPVTRGRSGPTTRTPRANMHHLLPLAIGALLVGTLSVGAAGAVLILNGSVAQTVAVLLPGAMLQALGAAILYYRRG